MKRIKLLILTFVLFAFITPVLAATASTSMSGTNTITVGGTTKIYVKLNSSDKIEGVDVTYATSGNIQVTNVSLGSGLTQMGKDGNRYILYANNPIASGSTILTITVKGTQAGTGTVKVTKLESTVSGTTVVSNTASYNITVKAPSVTPSNPNSNNNSNSNSNSNDEKEQALKKATILVEAAERSLIEEDYTDALKVVKALSNSNEKTALLNRLEEVRFQIAVNKACSEKNGTTNSNCNCPSYGECEKCKDITPWVILSIFLFLCLLGESIYLVKKLSKNN